MFMAKKIFLVNTPSIFRQHSPILEADTEFEKIPFDSDSSLHDAEIVIYAPYSETSFPDLIASVRPDERNGYSYIDDDIEKHSYHWLDQIEAVLQKGINVFVLLTPIEYFNMWKAGKSREFNNYFLSLAFNNRLSFLKNPIPKSGKGAQICAKNPILKDYYQEFKDNIKYNFYFDCPEGESLLLTSLGEDTIACSIKYQNGHIIFLPDIYFPNEFKENTIFSKRWLAAIKKIDKALKYGRNACIPPDWACKKEYQSKTEIDLLNQMQSADAELVKISNHKAKLETLLKEKSEIKLLLFGTGKPLEKAIIQALSILGFKHPTGYQDGQSEFDVIFTTPEGDRLLGEAEGKDSSAIDIGKMRQLNSNVDEDFEKNDLKTPAKGVLFGNAYRLKPIEARPEFFTDKCLSNAENRSVALVRTTDLHKAACYLLDNPNPDFAAKCRTVILDTIGEVEFPLLPVDSTKDAEETA